MQQGQAQYPLIDIKDFKAFAVWRWKSEELNQNCTICRKLMTETCNECEVNNEPNEEPRKCLIVQSSCGHAFHQHCIRGWIQARGQGGTSGTCPLCQVPWEINNEVEIQN